MQFNIFRIYLTSTDTHRRCRATGLLSQVIRGLPEGCLNATEGTNGVVLGIEFENIIFSLNTDYE